MEIVKYNRSQRTMQIFEWKRDAGERGKEREKNQKKKNNKMK